MRSNRRSTASNRLSMAANCRPRTAIKSWYSPFVMFLPRGLGPRASRRSMAQRENQSILGSRSVWQGEKHGVAGSRAAEATFGKPVGRGARGELDAAGGEAAALEHGLHQVHAEVVAEVGGVWGVQDQGGGLLSRL